MNGFSKFCCSVSILALIGGGITLGIGIAQGGKFHRFVGTEEKTYAYQVSQEEYNAYKANGTDVDLEIGIISGDIQIVESEDDVFKFNYTYRIDEKRVNFPTASSPFSLSEKNNTLDWFQFDFLFNYDSALTIHVPTWYQEEFDISAINGDIVSNVSNYYQEASFNGVNSNVTLYGIESSKKIEVQTVNGNIVIDASKFAAPTIDIEYKLGSVNGNASINLNSEATYHYTFDKTNGECIAEGATSDSGMHIIFKTVNGDLIISK